MHLGRERPPKTRPGTVIGGWQRASLTPQMPPSLQPTTAPTATRAANSAARLTVVKLLIAKNIATSATAAITFLSRLVDQRTAHERGGPLLRTLCSPLLFFAFSILAASRGARSRVERLNRGALMPTFVSGVRHCHGSPISTSTSIVRPRRPLASARSSCWRKGYDSRMALCCALGQPGGRWSPRLPACHEYTASLNRTAVASARRTHGFRLLGDRGLGSVTRAESCAREAEESSKSRTSGGGTGVFRADIDLREVA
jgi:hypothetical protein